MAGCSKVTETLRQEAVQMKAKGMKISFIAREVGRSKSGISRILQHYNDTNSSPPKAWSSTYSIKNAWEDRLMRRPLAGNGFNTAAGIACQFESNDQASHQQK